MREVRRSLAGRSMIIGVDRLDYSKGIGMRMRAFEDFLANYPRWRGAVTYLQITPRSRSDIREYAEMERRISETVGPRQRPLRRSVLDADPLRQPPAQPLRAGGTLPLLARGAGDAACATA